MIRARGIASAAATLALSCTLVACHDGAGAPASATVAAPATIAADARDGQDLKGADDAKGGVKLTPEDIAKLGLETTTVAAATHTDEVEGYGLVLPHEAIATAVAELMTAQATVRQSHSALARQARLKGTPGALSADFEEAALHQVAVDDAALTLAQRRLATIVGLNPPWERTGAGPAQLQELASGKLKMVRATFPVGTFAGSTPTQLRLSPLGVDRPGATWFVKSPWPAPADSAVPGRSVFGVWHSMEVSEGERLRVWGPSGAAERGVIVPASALVLSAGAYWCYVDKGNGKFVKVPIGIDQPVPQGYFVTGGVIEGDKVVTSAAGQLLAKDSNSGAEPD